MRSPRTRSFASKSPIYRQQLILDEGAVQENVQLKAASNYHGPASIADFHQVAAAVLVNPLNAIDQSVEIAAGSHDGVRVGNVVVASSGGLVGTVARVSSGVSRVTLLTDDQSAVTAIDLTHPSAVGVIKRGGGGSDVLILDRVSKNENVNVGDTIITAGTLGGPGALPSMFPRGIPIGIGHEPEQQRREPLQEHPGLAARRLLVAADRDRPRPEAD